MNDKLKILAFSAGALILSITVSLIRKVFSRDDKLISRKGIEILSSDENYEAMNKAIDRARKDNKKSATFKIDSNKEVTVMV